MKQSDIMLPVAAMVAQTALVSLLMMKVRLSDIASRRVKVHEVATSAGHSKYSSVLAADHFKNQVSATRLLASAMPVMLTRRTRQRAAQQQWR